MKRAARDEQDVIGLHHPVLGRHRRAFDQRQQVALHTLARHIGALRILTRGDLVELVDEHDPVLLRVGQRHRLQLFVVHHPCCFFVGEKPHRFGDADPARLLAPAADVREHSLDLLRQIFHPGRSEDLHRRRCRRYLDLDLAVVERPFAQHLSELLSRRIVDWLHVVKVDRMRRGNQQVEDFILGRVGGAIADLLHFRFAHLLDRDVGQVADDGVDVTTHVSDLGELRRLDLDERCIGQARETACDLGLANTGRPDHQDVLRCDLLPQRLADLLSSPSVAQCNRNGALGIVLPDDVLVELVDDFLRRHLRHVVSWYLKSKRRRSDSGGVLILP